MLTYQEMAMMISQAQEETDGDRDTVQCSIAKSLVVIAECAYNADRRGTR